jgi:sigma-B regulation protein RsbU (phosphoserine phosphatase)
LLPYTIPVLNGVQIAAHSAPAGIVGGDYFDFFHSKDGNQGVVIADVMGKGLPASMLMSNLQASLRILGPEIEEMDKLAYRVNELFRYNTNLISFISLFLAKIDSKNSTLEYCNAGHNPPIWWQSETKSIHQLKPSGPAIGLMHDVNYKSEKIKFNSGDLILIYTDGLVESRNEGNDEFGVQRITDIIDKNYSKSSEEFLSALLDSVKIFNGGNISDDITLLVLKIE